MPTPETCPECQKAPNGWLEQAKHSSRELFWVGCSECGHLVGGVFPSVAYERWNQYVSRWKFFKAAGKRVL